MNQNTMKGMGKLIEKLEKKRMYTEVKTTPSTDWLSFTRMLERYK